MKIGRLTASDRASAGIYDDLSGPEIETALAGVFAGVELTWERVLVPDEQPAIEAALRRPGGRLAMRACCHHRRNRTRAARCHPGSDARGA